MKFSAEFRASGPNRAREEAATLARMRILVDSRLVTEWRAPGQNSLHEDIVLPAYGLAEGFAYHWWTILYGRGRSTNVRSMRAGYTLPDISIKPIGNEAIEIQCKPFSYSNPPLEFVTGREEQVPVDTLKVDLQGFVEAVLKQLEVQSIPSTPLSDRFAAIIESMSDPEQDEFCKAAGSLGVDPYTCTDDVASFIETSGSIFQKDDLEEFLAGVTPANGNNAISWLKDAQQHADGWSELPAIEECRREIRFRRTSGAPWTAGYASARKLRGYFDFQDHEPVGSLTELAKLLGNERFHATERSTTGLRGVSRVSRNKQQAFVAGNPRPENLLFAVARTFGDGIHFGSPQGSPVTDQIGTYRQQLGRAFAAEFLAPVDAVMGMQHEGMAIEDIAAHFGVSDVVIQRQIENRNNNRAI